MLSAEAMAKREGAKGRVLRIGPSAKELTLSPCPHPLLPPPQALRAKELRAEAKGRVLRMMRAMTVMP